MYGDLDYARECVAFLYAGQPNASRGEPSPVGTCFFAKAASIRGSAEIEYLITARHVLEDLQTERRGASIRVNVDGGGVVFLPVDTDDGGWLKHADAAVDLAVLPWSFDRAGGYVLKFIDVDQMIDSMREGAWPVREGYNDAAFMGLMSNFAGTRKNLLPLRVGAISLITDELIKGPYGPSNYHVIDAQSYEANSGSPVWALAASTFSFWGVLVAGYPTKAELKLLLASGSTEEYLNIGLTLVTPAQKVVDILDSPSERRRRQLA